MKNLYEKLIDKLSKYYIIIYKSYDYYNYDSDYSEKLNNFIYVYKSPSEIFQTVMR